MSVARLAPSNSLQESQKLQQALLLYSQSGQWGLRAKLILEACGVPLLDGHANAKEPHLKPDSIVFRCGFDTFHDFISGPKEFSGMGFTWETWVKRVQSLILSERYSISQEHTPPQLILTLNDEVHSHLGRDASDAAEWHAISKLLHVGELRQTVGNLERSLNQSKTYLRLVMSRNIRLNKSLSAAKDNETVLQLQLDETTEELSDLNAQLSDGQLIPKAQLDALEQESNLKLAALERKLNARTAASKQAIAHILERCETLEAAVIAAQDATRLAAAREAELREMTELQEVELTEFKDKTKRLEDDVQESLNYVLSAEQAALDAQNLLKSYSGEDAISLAGTIEDLKVKLEKKNTIIRHIADIQNGLQNKVRLRGELISRLNDKSSKQALSLQSLNARQKYLCGALVVTAAIAVYTSVLPIM